MLFHASYNTINMLFWDGDFDRHAFSLYDQNDHAHEPMLRGHEIYNFGRGLSNLHNYAFSKRSPSKSGELTKKISMFIRTTIGHEQPGKFEGGYTKRIINRKNLLSITALNFSYFFFSFIKIAYFIHASYNIVFIYIINYNITISIIINFHKDSPIL